MGARPLGRFCRQDGQARLAPVSRTVGPRGRGGVRCLARGPALVARPTIRAVCTAATRSAASAGNPSPQGEDREQCPDGATRRITLKHRGPHSHPPCRRFVCARDSCILGGGSLRNTTARLVGGETNPSRTTCLRRGVQRVAWRQIQRMRTYRGNGSSCFTAKSLIKKHP